MAEINFCLKSFFYSLLVVFGMQMHFSGRSLESRANEWLHTSALPLQLQKVADGGTLVFLNAKKALLEISSHAFGKSDPNTQKASR
jgi:hypothetical protein